MDSARFKAELIPCSTDFYRIAFRIIGNAEDARDIVQELFVKLWNIRNKLDAISSPKAFAIAMLRNMCIDKLRTDSRWPQRISAELAAGEPDESPPDDNEDKFRNIADAAEALPETQRKIFYLKYFKGCKINEISKITGFGQTNIRVILMRARNSIKNKLKEYEIE